MRQIITSPIWEQPDGVRRPPLLDEVRDDLPVVGWCNIAVIELGAEVRRFVLSHRVPA